MSPKEDRNDEVTDASKYELQELFVAGVQGDPFKYADFLKLTAALLRPALKRKVPVSDVDDVIQEILSSIHRSRHTYDNNRPIMPWIFSIAHFRVTDYLRKNLTVDWSVRDTVRAKMRGQIKLILKRHKYPPDMESRAVDLVLKQAEALSTAWMGE